MKLDSGIFNVLAIHSNRTMGIPMSLLGIVVGRIQKRSDAHFHFQENK